jgi:hypothetical protein
MVKKKEKSLFIATEKSCFFFVYGNDRLINERNFKTSFFFKCLFTSTKECFESSLDYFPLTTENDVINNSNNSHVAEQQRNIRRSIVLWLQIILELYFLFSEVIHMEKNNRCFNSEKKMCRVSARRLSIYNFAWELLKATNLQAESKILKYFQKKYVWYLKSVKEPNICMEATRRNLRARFKILKKISDCQINQSKRKFSQKKFV